MSGPRLWLLRHAQPLVPHGTCYGRLDVAADAAATASALQHWTRALPQGYVLRHSSLQRCVQLAHGLQAAHGIAAQPDARLQEMDFGTWEGQPWAAIDAAAIDAWAQDLAQTAPGGGESLAAMLQRVHTALADAWHTDSQHGTRDVVWVTHAGTIRCVQWLLQHGLPLPTSADWRLPAPAFGEGVSWWWADHAATCQRLATSAPR